MQIVTILILAFFIEAIVGALKPLWSAKEGARMSIAELVSIGLGIVLAVVCRINLLGGLIELDAPGWTEYIFYIMTGIALGRGPAFVHDLWAGFRAWQGNYLTAIEGTTDDDIVNVDHWDFDTLKEFCRENDIDTEGCETREDYYNAITRGEKQNE